MGFSGSSFIKVYDQLLATGRNEFGQLGLEDNNNRNSFTKVQLPDNIGTIAEVACGGCHTFIRDTKGELLATGRNEFGQLGLEDNNRNSFTRIRLPDNSGFILEVACGVNYTFILNDRGQLFATGHNRSGELGLEDNNNRNSFTQVQLPDNSGRIAQVACGVNHTFILDDGGQLFAKGNNRSGELGLGHNDYRNSFRQVQLPDNSAPIAQIACGWYHTFIRDDRGKLFATGSNAFGRLGLRDNENKNSFTQVQLPDNSVRIAQVACGVNHTFIRDTKGKLFATGDNRSGELGLGHNDYINSFTPIQLPGNIDTIAEVACGMNHTFIRDTTGKLFATGKNDRGQLGLGNNNNKYSFTHIPNSSLEDYYDQANSSLQDILRDYICFHKDQFNALVIDLPRGTQYHIKDSSKRIYT